MNNFKKLLIATLAVILLLGATPLAAKLEGTWAGNGEGSCPFPFPYPSEYMEPWQKWKGLVENEEVFYGNWYDGDGNHGTFKGEILFVTPTEAYCEGEWTVINDYWEPPLVYPMGPFSMKFELEELICYGEWQTYDSNYNGTMKGEKTD